MSNIRQKIKEEIAADNYKGAERLLEELRRNNPSDFTIDLLTELISLYLKENRLHEAIDLLSSEEKRFEKVPLFYRTFSGVYRTLGDKKQAIHYINKAINIEPNNPLWRTSLGLTYWLFSDVEKAIETTKETLKYIQDEDSLEAIMIKNNLAYYYAQAGLNKEEAMKYATFCYERRDREDLGQQRKAHILDTYGYVIMKFAQKSEDIDKAIILFKEAIKEGIPSEAGDAHIEEAEKKRESLKN